MDQQSFGARFKNWKNQYIELVESKTDRIVSLTEPRPSPEQVAHTRTWRSGFQETVVEIGSGSGGHLLERASQHPEFAFIGFELRFKRAFRTIQKAEQKSLSNVFLVRADARTLGEFFEPQSLRGVYVNFPDPWDKAKWKKNRVLNADSLKIIAQLVMPGGFFSYKSDHSGYFDETVSILREIPNMRIQKLTRNLYASEYLNGNVASEFESLFRSQGQEICFLEAIIV